MKQEKFKQNYCVMHTFPNMLYKESLT